MTYDPAAPWEDALKAAERLGAKVRACATYDALLGLYQEVATVLNTSITRNRLPESPLTELAAVQEQLKFTVSAIGQVVSVIAAYHALQSEEVLRGEKVP